MRFRAAAEYERGKVDDGRGVQRRQRNEADVCPQRIKCGDLGGLCGRDGSITSHRYGYGPQGKHNENGCRQVDQRPRDWAQQLLQPDPPGYRYSSEESDGRGNAKRGGRGHLESFANAQTDEIGRDSADGQSYAIPGNDPCDQGADHACCRLRLPAVSACCTAASVAVSGKTGRPDVSVIMGKRWHVIAAATTDFRRR